MGWASRVGWASRSGPASLLVGASAVAALIAGCGGIEAPDLFIVQRSGGVPGARLTLLVNEEGGVRCNGGPELKLSDPQIVQARAIQEELKSPASERLSLPAKPGSVLEYHLRDENGSVSFADNSAGQPKVLRNLALFVLQVAEGVCKLPQQGA
ncbi:MAG TPA: hypothetical protein VES65_01575 [Solirubrobacteraceae bacterium]|nr:hypothetical protein [Solirubrobacteraceae bacterium]